MKWLITLFLILGTLSGCMGEKENSEKNTNHQKKEDTSLSKKDADQSKSGSSIKKEETANGNSTATGSAIQRNQGLKLYRPKVGTKKVFVGADNTESFKEEIVFENDTYVQSIVRIGQSSSVVIYKWTNDEIAIVSIVESSSNPYKNHLDGIKESKKPEIMISNQTPSQAIWKVMKKDETVQTPYKSFTNVYVIQKITNEVEGAETIYTYYIAPGIGIVKELYKVTGDQGYTEESVLQKVEE